MRIITVTFTIFLFILFAYVGICPCGISFAQPIPASEPTQPKAKPTIAVTTFENLSAYPENGWVAMSFSEALTVKLKRLYERFIVVERIRIYDVIRERGLRPDAIESAPQKQQREIGALLGASYLILGSVSLQGLADEPTTKLLANMRTVDVRTGELKEATSVSGQMKEIFDLEIQLAFAFLKQVGVDITAAEEQQLSIKETESLLTEKYYNLGNQHFYDGNLEMAEAWYKKAIDLTEGGYHREAALRWVEVLKKQKSLASTETDERTIHEKAGQRIETILKRRAETNEMYFEEAELHMIREEYEQAIMAYQLYLEKASPFRLVKWKTTLWQAPTANRIESGINIHFLARHEDVVYVQYVESGPVNPLDTVGPETKSKPEEILYRAKIHLNALNAETGKMLWKFEVEQQGTMLQLLPLIATASAPVIAGGIVYTVHALADKSHVYALDAHTGKLKWQFELGKETQAERETATSLKYSPVSLMTAEGLVLLIIPHEGVLLALSAETGEEEWRKPIEVKVSPFGYGELACTEVIDGMLYIGTQDGVSALAAQTGEQLWYTQVGEVTTVPIVVNDLLYIGANRGIYVFHRRTGKILTEMIQGTYIYSLLMGDELLYILDGQSIQAMAPETGEIKWNSALGLGYVITYMKVANGKLYYPRFDGLTALAADTGHPVWQFNIKHRNFAATKQSVCIAAEDEKSLYYLQVETGEILWKFAMPEPMESIGKYSIAADGTAYLVSSSGHQAHLYALNPKLQGVTPGTEDVYALLGIGRAYLALSQYQEAIETFKKAIASGIELAEGYRQLALAYEGEKRFSKATENWSVALSHAMKAGEAPKDVISHLWNLAGVRWVAEGGHEIKITKNGIYGISADGSVFARNLDAGRIQWRLPNGSLAWFTPGFFYLTVTDETVYVVNSAVSAFALHAKTGELKWKFQIEMTSNVHSILTPPAVVDGIVYLMQADKEFNPIMQTDRASQLPSYAGTLTLYALSAETGKIKWKFETEREEMPFYLAASIFHTLPLEPPHVIISDLVYWKSPTGYLYALAKDTGELVWKFQTGVEEGEERIELPSGIEVPPIAVIEDTLFVQTKEYLYALEKGTGKVKWKQQIEGINPTSPVIAANETIYIHTSEPVTEEDEQKAHHSLYALKKNTGEMKWKFAETTSFFFKRNAAPMIVDGTIYLSLGENLYALRSDTGEMKWKTNGYFGGIQAVTGDTIYLPGIAWTTDFSQLLTEVGVVAVACETGAVKWRYSGVVPMKVINGLLFVAGGGNLFQGFCCAFDLTKIEQLLAEGKKWWE